MTTAFLNIDNCKEKSNKNYTDKTIRKNKKSAINLTKKVKDLNNENHKHQ